MQVHERDHERKHSHTRSHTNSTHLIGKEKVIKGDKVLVVVLMIARHPVLGRLLFQNRCRIASIREQ